MRRAYTHPCCETNQAYGYCRKERRPSVNHRYHLTACESGRTTLSSCFDFGPIPRFLVVLLRGILSARKTGQLANFSANPANFLKKMDSGTQSGQFIGRGQQISANKLATRPTRPEDVESTKGCAPTPVIAPVSTSDGRQYSVEPLGTAEEQHG